VIISHALGTLSAQAAANTQRRFTMPLRLGAALVSGTIFDSAASVIAIRRILWIISRHNVGAPVR
jgi:hypothetical protein